MLHLHRDHLFQDMSDRGDPIERDYIIMTSLKKYLPYRLFYMVVWHKYDISYKMEYLFSPLPEGAASTKWSPLSYTKLMTYGKYIPYMVTIDTKTYHIW